jgi:hypothetical protein
VLVRRTKYYSGEKIEWVGHVTHVWRRTDMHTEFWYGNLKTIDHLEDLGLDGSVISDYLKQVEWVGVDSRDKFWLMCTR